MSSVELNIVTLKHNVTPNNTYAVVLKEKHGFRRLAIIIGHAEAHSIAVALENMQPPRPMTHDLFLNTIKGLNANLVSIKINEIKEGIFYSLLFCELDGNIYEIDSRTSDALALAVRFQCPIYTTEKILDEVALTVYDEQEADIEDFEDEYDEDDLVEIDRNSRRLEDLPTGRLEEMMNDMLDKEDYEAAAQIRDILNQRK